MIGISYMTILKRASLSLVLIGLLSASALAQTNAQPPQRPDQSSSLAEILDWLDKNGLAYARVGVKGSVGKLALAMADSYTATGPIGYPSATTLNFSQGFKLSKVDACTLTLRNEDAQLIGKSEIGDKRTHFAVELILPLDQMSDRKGKTISRYTGNLDKAKVFGTWRTEFTYKGFFSRVLFETSLFAPHTIEIQSSWIGNKATFTFDDKETAEQFSTVFRRAIKLCAKK